MWMRFGGAAAALPLRRAGQLTKGSHGLHDNEANRRRYWR